MPLSIAELGSRLGEIVHRVRLTGQRVEITCNGTPAAMIVPLGDIETLERLEEQADIIALERARLEGGDSIPFEDFLKEMEKGE